MLSLENKKVIQKCNDKDTEKKEKWMKYKHGQACRYLKIGELNKAEAHFQDILATVINEFGEMNHRVGATLHNIGIVRLRIGHLDGALDSIKEATRIRRATLGESHPKVADSLVEKGIIMLSLEHFDESIEAFNEAIEIREMESTETKSKQKREKITLQIAKILNNIGSVYFEYGDLDNAVDTYEEALDMQRESIKEKGYKNEPEFLAMASTMCNIGYVYLEENKWCDAIPIIEEALKIQQAILEPASTQILNTLENLAFAFSKIQKHEQAIKLYTKILHTQEVYTDINNCDCLADTMSKLVYNFMALYEYDKALEYLKEIERIQEDILDPESPKLKETRNLIKCANYEKNKYSVDEDVIPSCLTTNGIMNPFDSTIFQWACTKPNKTKLDLRRCVPQRPEVAIKMSGHKISYT